VTLAVKAAKKITSKGLRNAMRKEENEAGRVGCDSERSGTKGKKNKKTAIGGGGRGIETEGLGKKGWGDM